MPKKVYNNIEDYRLYIDGYGPDNVVEDVTSVSVPTISHPTSEIKASGMIMAIEMPNQYAYEAMEFQVSHNNGINSNKLATPGRHILECRVARQVYNVERGEMEHASVKIRVEGLHSSTDKGSFETGNPYGSTDTFKVIGYEEEQDGVVLISIHGINGTNKINGVSYSDEIERYL